MIRRLRIKFVCNNMFIVTVMLLVIFSTVFHFTRQNLQAQSYRAMERVSGMYLTPVRPGEEMDMAPDKIPVPFFAAGTDFDGNILLLENAYFNLPDEALLEELIRTADAAGEKWGLLREYRLRYGVFITPTGKRFVFIDISGEMETVRNLLSTCVLMGTVSFFVFLLISIQLAQWSIAPLETAWNQQKQFVADASHELKTPLTVIMTNAELLQEEAYSPAERKRFAEHILTMSLQMRGLVEELLELARMDSETAGLPMETVELSEAVEQTLLLFEPIYFENGRVLESAVEPGIRVRGSEQHLRQVLEILLDNGVKYSTEGGTVRAELFRQGSSCLLSVASPGETISREDSQNIFKRFYRADPVRSMNRSYGLGLPIASGIVEKHKGRIWCQSSDGINTFWVQLDALQNSDDK